MNQKILRNTNSNDYAVGLLSMKKKNFLATSHKCEHFWTNKHAIFELPVKTSK